MLLKTQMINRNSSLNNGFRPIQDPDPVGSGTFIRIRNYLGLIWNLDPPKMKEINSNFRTVDSGRKDQPNLFKMFLFLIARYRIFLQFKNMCLK